MHRNYWWNNLPCYTRVTNKHHVTKTIEHWKHEFHHINNHIDELYAEIIGLISKRDEIVNKVNSNLESKIKMLQDMKLFLDKESCNSYTVFKDNKCEVK